MFLLKAHRPALYGERLRVDLNSVRAEVRRVGEALGYSETKIQAVLREAEHLYRERRGR